MQIKTVFFDMDNTLVDTEWAAAKAVRLIVNSYDRQFSKQDELAVLGSPWNTVFDNALKNYNLPVDREVLKEQVLTKKSELLTDGHGRTLPGAIEAVKLCASKWPVAVVSGSFRKEITSTLEHLNLCKTVQFIVGNEDVESGKPAPDPYLLAAKRLGIEQECCLVFEDSFVGISSAKAAGMFCVAVKAVDTGFDLGSADIIIDTLKSVSESWLNNLIHLGD